MIKVTLVIGFLAACSRPEPVRYSPAFEFDLTPARAPATDGALAEYALRVMEHCRVTHSVGRRQVLAAQVGRVAAREFPDRSHAQAFVALLCIESKFESDVKSSAGAVGIAQLMPQYAQSFAGLCGLGRIERRDLDSTEVNLRLGACYFRSLLDQFGGNVALALSAYNSGAASKTTAQLRGLGSSNPETAGYLARHYVLTHQAAE